VLTQAEYQVATDRAIAGIDQVLTTVAAILRIGEVAHGRRKAAFAPLDLGSLLQEVAELYEPLAEERHVAFDIRVGLAAPVDGDHDLMVEALGNLVDNAVKYAPAGTEITLSLHSDAEGAYLQIVDRGIGIPPHERGRVLQRFYRLDPSRTESGIGLGLPLVAAVVGLHQFQLRIGDAGPGCLVEIICPVHGAGTIA
jgi:signal transduction histidine kinase